MKRITSLLLCSIASNITWAANDWYTIEVITFTQGSNASIDAENWPINPRREFPVTAMYLSSAAEIIDELYADKYSYQPPLLDNIILDPDLLDTNLEPQGDPIETQDPTLIIAPAISDWAQSIYQKLNYVAEFKQLTTSLDTHPITEHVPSRVSALEIESGPAVSEKEFADALNTFSEFLRLDSDEAYIDARQLERRGYRILSQDIWRQYIPANSKGKTIIITGGQQFGEHFELEGTITFDRIRYLHTDINLWYNQFTINDDQEETLPPLPSRYISTESELINSVSDASLNRIDFVSSQSYPIHEVKRMRSEVTYYIDHPVFGVIVRVNRYEERDELFEKAFNVLQGPHTPATN